MTETAIAHSPFRDLYIALSEPTAYGAWAVRIYVKPYIIWIWIGGIMIAMGAALSLLALNKSTDRKG
jgi:cytochrome c-type biogenesis protein CcmF